MFCPAAGGNYTCARGEGVHANRYTWTVNVGVGNRTFRAHVRDPPDDTTPPSIVLGAPMPGAVLPTESGFDIVATFLDDHGVARAELNWPRRDQARWLP